MTHFLEFKDKLAQIYSKYDTYILAGLKFFACFFLMLFMERQTSFAHSLDYPVLMFLGAAALCALFPQSMISICLSAFLLLQMKEVSIECVAMLAMILVIVTAGYYSFKPGNSILMALSVLFTCWKVPGIIIIIAGIVAGPFSVIPVGFGVIIGTYVQGVSGNLAMVSAENTSMELLQKLLFLSNLILKNPMLWLYLLLTVVIIVMVYVIRKMSISYSWLIAAATGAVLYVVISVLGGYVGNVDVSLFPTILAAVLGMAFAVAVYMFVYALDYSEIENVCFEDDDYVYYVKAVPKMKVTKSQVLVKTINERLTPEERKIAEEAENDKKPETEKNEDSTVTFEPISVAIAGEEEKENPSATLADATAEIPMITENDQPQVIVPEKKTDIQTREIRPDEVKDLFDESEEQEEN